MQELYIDDRDGLRGYLDAIASEASFAIDTEFVREKTFYPQLCLVQIASSDAIAVVDCLAGFELAPLFDHLLREGSEWIVHSGRQDLEVVYQDAGRLPPRLVDTQIAAGLVGYPPQIGLQDLLARLLGIELDKQYTRTDWSRRPLPDAAVEYARDDVRSLRTLWSKLSERLDELGRRAWLEQDCALALGQAPVTPPEQVWSRLKGLRSLDEPGAAAALAIVEWRERRAQTRNRPRRWILGDAQIVTIARARPRSIDELRALPGLPAKLADRAGSELLAAIRAGEEPAARARARASAAMAEPPDRQRLRSLKDEVDRVAAALGISPEVLATKQELSDVIAGRPAPRIEATWRAGELRELLAANA